MARKKPIDPAEHARKARAIYDADRRAYRFGLFVGAPLVAVALLVVKESKALPIGWLVIIGPAVVVALFCCLGLGCAEFNWWMYRRHVARREARGFEVLPQKRDE